VIGDTHGGTDLGPAPRLDFSTNANPLGPDPHVMAALRDVNVSAYPEPSYTAVRGRLGAFHEVDPACVVVGAGASELIRRLVTWWSGPIVVTDPTFGEYAAAAFAVGRRVITAGDDGDFLAALGGGALGFLCVPNNPDGRLPLEGFVEQAAGTAGASGGLLVIDAAYAPFCSPWPVLSSSAVVLHAPNKVHGCTGLRAGYAVVPSREMAIELRRVAPSWVVGNHGASFLAASVTSQAQEWVNETTGTLRTWRADLADGFRVRGFAVIEGPANFLLVDVGHADTVTETLRADGLRVRSCVSFGLPRHVRIAALAPEANTELLASVDRSVPGGVTS